MSFNFVALKNAIFVKCSWKENILLEEFVVSISGVANSDSSSRFCSSHFCHITPKFLSCAAYVVKLENNPP